MKITRILSLLACCGVGLTACQPPQSRPQSSPASSPKATVDITQCQKVDDSFVTAYQNLQKQLPNNTHDLSEKALTQYQSELNKLNQTLVATLKNQLKNPQVSQCEFPKTQQAGVEILTTAKDNYPIMRAFSWQMGQTSATMNRGKEYQSLSTAHEFGSLLQVIQKDGHSLFDNGEDNNNMGKVVILKSFEYNQQHYFLSLLDFEYIACDHCAETAPVPFRSTLSVFNLTNNQLAKVKFEDSYANEQDTLHFARTKTDYLKFEHNQLTLKSIEIAPNDGYIDAYTRYTFDGKKFKYQRFDYIWKD